MQGSGTNFELSRSKHDPAQGPLVQVAVLQVGLELGDALRAHVVRQLLQMNESKQVLTDLLLQNY